MQISSPVVVGREGELALLTSRIRGARLGDGHTVFMVADAGLGKTRLANEAAYTAFNAGMPVMRGRATSIGTMMPFRPLAEALASVLRSSGPPEHPDLLPYRHALSRFVPGWREVPGHASGLMELAEAVLRLLGVLGEDTGCLLILEDLHDADAETLAVIEYLVDNLNKLPVFVLASLRPQHGPALDLAQSAGQRRAAEVLELAPLDREQVRSMAANCLATDPASVPTRVLERLSHDADGNPFVIEELLAAMVSSGVLRRDRDSWRLTGALGADIPNTVVRSVSDRVDRLGAQARDLLHVAATLGHRFPLSVLQCVSGLDDRGLLGQLRAATDAQLITPDPGAPDWYTFRHALTAEALLSALLPAERADLARRTADAIAETHPAMPEDWSQLVADLRVTAGQHPAAALLLADAGRRTLAAGSILSALKLLERAQELDPQPEIRESLVHALAEAGHLDRALDLVGQLPSVMGHREGLDHRAGLHSRLAYAAIMARRFQDADGQVAAARHLLGPDSSPEHAATLDIVTARLVFNRPGDRSERLATAFQLARRAADVAEQVPLPEVACRAWQFLSGLARADGYEAADAWLERILSTAEKHNLPAWRIDALMRLGVNEFLRTGVLTRLHLGRRAAQQLGSIVLGLSTEIALGMPSVLCGDFGTTKEITDRAETSTTRMQNLGELQSVLLAKAVMHAHQGQRRQMEEVLARLRDAEGQLSPNRTVVLGLCRAVCALLEEDPGLAAKELDDALAWELENPTVYYLTGRYGLRLLVEVAAGRAGWEAHDEVTGAPTSTLRWNQQFVLFARAILHGRSGRPEEAAAAFEEAVEAAAVFPMAAHLGRRLVAEAAIVDGWGEPAVWLRAAEEYFHTAEVPAVASACRALLRRAGASAVQRRAGRDQIPAELRACGVTVREYEVFELLADHPGNQGIAKRLYISPRTVEKHVASLLAKTGHPDRAALSGFARQLLA